MSNYRKLLLEVYAVAYRLGDETVLKLCANALRVLRDEARQTRSQRRVF